MSTVESLSSISQQFAIYFGFPVFLAGIIGNCLNIVMFLSKKVFLHGPCQLYLLTASISSLFAVIFPLLLRILIALQYDLTKTSLFFCKSRQYLGHVSILTALTCVSLATIDRYLISCRDVRFRNMSKITFARLLCVLTVVFWSLHGLPIVIMVNIYPAAGNQTVCANRSAIYGYYLNYFIILILYNILPLSIFIIFGFLTWKNMRMVRRRQHFLPVNQRQEHQLTKMLLLQIVSIGISTIPYTIYTLYSVITSQIPQKDPLRVAKENLCATVVNLVFYVNFAASFYIYFCSSRSVRNKFLVKLFSPCGRCQQLAHAISTVTPATGNNTRSNNMIAKR